MTVGAVAAAVAALAGGGGAVVWWLRRTFLVATVSGSSMLPTYADGVRLLVRRVPLTAIRRGDVVVLVDDELPPSPTRPIGGRRQPPGELIIKRAAAVPGDPVPAGIPVSDAAVPAARLVVLGDNPEASYDSRKAGYYTAAQLIGVVVRPMTAR